MTILVIGLGFVGLTTALGFATKGFQVYGYDIDEMRSKTISSGRVPFLEDGLPEVLEDTLGLSFHVVDTLEDVIGKTDIIFFCVGTPCDERGKADIQYLKDGLKAISINVKKDCLLVVKSTIPPGTLQNEIVPYVRELGIDNSVAVNPEFLREGQCWQDFVSPDRIICGIEDHDNHAEHLLRTVYEPFCAPIHFVTPNTAEFIKYLSNSLLASLISFSNEMAEIAKVAGNISVGEAFRILHEDNRLLGAKISSYIYPGCGYGGYCLPKDTVALVENSKGNGFEPKILQNVIELNNKMPKFVAERIIQNTSDKKTKLGILGLSFKPESDDVRDSPAMKIIQELLLAGYSDIYVYDPIANENFRKAYNFPINYCSSKEAVCSVCSVVAVVTTWKEFKGIDKRYPNIIWEDCRYFL